MTTARKWRISALLFSCIFVWMYFFLSVWENLRLYLYSGHSDLHEHFLLICMHLLNWTSWFPDSITDSLKAPVHHALIRLSCCQAAHSLTSLYYRGKPMELQCYLSQPILHGPYILNDRLPATYRMFDPTYWEYSVSSAMQSCHGQEWVWTIYMAINLHTQGMHCRNMQIWRERGAGRRGRQYRSHMSWPLGYNGLWICVCT